MAYITFKPSDYFISKSWDTSAATSQTVTTGMQPDMIWADDLRGTRSSAIYDAVRGFDKQSLVADDSAETTVTAITSVSATGFVTGVNDYTNPNHGAASNPNMDGYSWKAGNGTVTNTAGDVDSTVSVNTTAGISIVKWNNNTSGAISIGHGLGAIPDAVIVKKTDGTANWHCRFKDFGANDYISLNNTEAKGSSTGVFGTLPTSTLFYTGTAAYHINSNLIAYCFASKKGFSKIGNYTGTGDVNSQYIYTGFQPSWVMIKRTDSTAGWYIRNISQAVSGTTPYIGNVAGSTSGYGKLQYVYANATGATTTSNATGDDIISFTSTGFQVTSTANGTNVVDGDYMYMAFAKNPIVGSNGTTGVAL